MSSPTCRDMSATFPAKAWKRAVKITAQEHEAIVEEAGRCVRLEFSKDEDSNDIEDDESGSEVESDGDDNSLN